MPKPKFVEDVPCLDIGLLKRSGLFARRRTTRLRLEIEGAEVIASGSAVASVVGLQIGSAPVQSVDTIFVPLTFGERLYFVCPKTSKRATKLYLVDGVFASREGHGLVHLVTTGRREDVERARSVHIATRLSGAALGKSPARGTRRRRLISELNERGDEKYVGQDVRRLLVPNKEIRKRAETALDSDKRRTVTTSTAYLLERGRQSLDGWAEAEVAEAMRDLVRGRQEGVFPTFELPDDLTPDFLLPRVRLDARSLQKAGLLDPGGLRYAAFVFDRSCSTYLSWAWFAFDMRDPADAWILMRGKSVGLRETSEQAIRVEHRNDRPYLVCPFTKTRRTTLYLREGLFGSHRALKLRASEFDVPEEPQDEGWAENRSVSSLR